MDYSQIVYDALEGLWWLIPLALLIGFVKSPWFKGIVGEALVKAVAKFRLPAETYPRLIHEGGLKTKIADGILLKNQCVPPRT